VQRNSFVGELVWKFFEPALAAQEVDQVAGLLRFLPLQHVEAVPSVMYGNWLSCETLRA
jgi:hypothetical protein